MNQQKKNSCRQVYYFEPLLSSQSGQSMAEFLIIIPVMLLLIFGSIQFALIFHAKITLNYAIFEAVRAGTLGNGKFVEVKEGFARGFAPLYSYSNVKKGAADKRTTESVENQVKAFHSARDKIYKEFDSTNKLIRIEKLNPSHKNLRLFSAEGDYLPNDNLTYRSSIKKGKGKVSLQDLNLLHLRVTYWYPLYVPFVNKLFFNSFICHKIPANSSGKWSTDPICIDPDQEPVIPLTAVAVMRMQSPMIVKLNDGYFDPDSL